MKPDKGKGRATEEDLTQMDLVELENGLAVDIDFDEQMFSDEGEKDQIPEDDENENGEGSSRQPPKTTPKQQQKMSRAKKLETIQNHPGRTYRGLQRLNQQKLHELLPDDLDDHARIKPSSSLANVTRQELPRLPPHRYQSTISLLVNHPDYISAKDIEPDANFRTIAPKKVVPRTPRAPKKSVLENLQNTINAFATEFRARISQMEQDISIMRENINDLMINDEEEDAEESSEEESGDDMEMED